jgi:hypothetical protein
MDMRRWLERCAREQLTELTLVEFPGEGPDPDGDRLLQASNGRRGVERVVSVAEQSWLLTHWPAARRAGGSPGELRGPLR